MSKNPEDQDEPKSPLKLTRKFGWPLRHLMIDHNIRSAAALQRKLEEIGVNISSVQVTRIVLERPVRIKVELLDALATIFNCTANDLLPVRHVTPEEVAAEALAEYSIRDDEESKVRRTPAKNSKDEKPKEAAPEEAKPVDEKPKGTALMDKTLNNVVQLSPKKGPRKKWGAGGPDTLTPLPNPSEDIDED